MTLLDAQESDPIKDHRKKQRIVLGAVLAAVILAIGVLGFLENDGWWFSYWPAEHRVSNFFSALQKQDFNTAYAIWQHDPQWPQHPGNFTYKFGEFYRDWGPSGQWGVIKTAKVNGAHTCPPLGSGTSGSGLLVDVIVNNRVEHAQVWVESSDHTLGFPPCELEFR